MHHEEIVSAENVINRSLRFYQKKLTWQLEAKTEVELNNGNAQVNKLEDYESNIKRIEIILSNLATIKRAIKNKQSTVMIYGEMDTKGYTYKEITDVLNKAGINHEYHGYTGKTVWLSIK